MAEKIATCTFCDGGCVLKIRDEEGRLRVEPADPAFPAICSKTRMIDEYRLHEARIIHPLRCVGERGSGRWEEVSWDEALDDIASRLRRVIDTWGLSRLRCLRCLITTASAASPDGS